MKRTTAIRNQRLGEGKKEESEGKTKKKKQIRGEKRISERENFKRTRKEDKEESNYKTATWRGEERGE